MNELLVFWFEDEFDADEVRTTLMKMRHDHLVDLEDAIVARRNQEGEIKLRLIHHFPDTGVVGGGMGGILRPLVGSILINSMFDYIVEEAGTTLDEKMLADIGISKEFMSELATVMEPGTSALFVLVMKADPEKVLEELEPFHGKVLRTYLRQNETAIRKALASVK